MSILITGATGLVGQALTKKLQSQGESIHYLTTSANKIEDHKNYKGFLWNPNKFEIDTKCFEGVTCILHLAGASIAERWTDEYKTKIIESRINTAQLLFDTLNETENNVEHFVSASAIGAYPSSKTINYSESFETYNPSFLGEVVEVWEAAADKFKELEIKVSKIRIGVVLAKDGGALEKLLQPIKIYVGAPLGDGKQWQSWIHIEDLAAVFTFVVLNQLEGVYNAVAPFPVTNEAMTKEAASILKKPLFLPNVPAFMLKIILGEMAAIVLESQKVSSKKIEQQGFDFRFKKLDVALQDLLA
ncbi:TIGR01777 family oxidoreductase [Leeuwenhoekiella sp. W20_SRS_FM14]|uniref:TIGR01777 family oxidoreductase n=1 Tax=Leeuwenhoekiella sp. W20_SRS_FM14 TaxID=3240270 RepID=UPI003F9E5744